MLIVLEKIGWGMLALTGFVGGIIGLALPVIPQVPFFLLALFALSKLSPRFHRWKSSMPSVSLKIAFVRLRPNKTNQSLAALQRAF